MAQGLAQTSDSDFGRDEAQLIHNLRRFHEVAQCTYQVILDRERDQARDKDLIQVWGSTPEFIAAKTHILEFLASRYPRMKRFATSAIPIRVWEPPKTSPYYDSLEALDLNIPAVEIHGESWPNLLLHRLGDWTGEDLNRRIGELFVQSEDPCNWLYHNTSGSGKTRTLLEGLCRHWGLYFSCAYDPYIGSADLATVLRDPLLGSVLKDLDLDDPDHTKQHANNLANVNPMFTRVLLARVIFLYYFALEVTAAKRDSSGLQCKRNWSFLQIYPKLLSAAKDTDIFLHFITILRRAKLTQDTMQGLLNHFLNDLAQKLPLAQDKLFVVVDEAQTAADLHKKAFKSMQEKDHRPILRELVMNWNVLIPDKQEAWGEHPVQSGFIVTGTGIDVKLIKDALSSTVCKHAQLSEFHNTGVFNVADGSQSAYALQFFPREFTETKEGTTLLNGMSHWLRGRYEAFISVGNADSNIFTRRHRLTAAFITYLLYSGFSKPHTLLNRYIEQIAGVTPTDAAHLIRREGEGHEVDCSVVKLDSLQYERLRGSRLES
ncbi:hypothetical protein WG66_007347 [Moniliophthora roreri]|uniref:Uncharacterized protein n=1 Tax=Moniliophthora roreri TaxID=221103 RepID=A0A0W0FN64_MONRR|nr:hypothetical protein WG66_007347 [Moniliophthora roreri]